MNTIETIRTISILRENLKNISIAKNKGKTIDPELEYAVESIIQDTIKHFLNDLSQSHIDINIAGDYCDRYLGQSFEKLESKDIIALSKLKNQNYDKIKKFLNKDDLYYILVDAIKKDILCKNKHFEMDDTTIEVQFSSNGLMFEYSCDSTSFCGERDYISEQTISVDELI